MKDKLKPLPQFDHDLQVREDEDALEGVSRFRAHCSCEWAGEWHEAPASEYFFLPNHAEEAAWAEADQHGRETLLPALVAISQRHRGRRIRVVSRAHGGAVYEGVCLAPRTEPADRAIFQHLRPLPPGRPGELPELPAHRRPQHRGRHGARGLVARISKEKMWT